MNRALFQSAAALFLVIAGTAHAATAVYKCTGKDGAIEFSPQPCGKDAKQVDTSSALRTGTSPNLQGVSDMAAMASIDVQCRNQARAINDLAAADASAADRDIDRLRYEMSRSLNNIGGATRDNGIRSQIAAAEDRKANAYQSQRASLAELQRTCDAQRADQLKAQRERDERSTAVKR